MQEGGIKLIRFLAGQGCGSRRVCQRLLVEDRVSVNGATVRQPSLPVDPEKDSVTVDGKIIRPAVRDKVYLLLNKPKGILCTREDPKGRPTVYGLIRHRALSSAGLFTAGRLDFNTTGLLVMTNDGDFANMLTHPRYGVVKQYIAEVKGRPDDDLLERTVKGVVMDGERLRFNRILVLKPGQKTTVLKIWLNEGKNQEIRRMFAFFSVKIRSLKRVRVGDFDLRDLAEGGYRLLKKKEVLDFMARTLKEYSEKEKKHGTLRRKHP
jgi:pseudouridine synthase